MGGATPGRAVYEFRRPGDPAPGIPWEELGQDGRDFYEGQARAGAALAVAAERERIRQVAIDANAVTMSRTGRMLPFEELLRRSPEEAAAALAEYCASPAFTGARTPPPSCSSCGRNPVAVPKAGPFGLFCQECIDRCHDSEIADHRCPVCAGSPS